ncbi:MAG: hypothetical protein DRQ51_04240 [Gammaproteobacteria bacterium]|nr:MAG: hypothetical protein DRQ51_04240 [Gammaproteobacteria bacterium]
MNLKFQTPKDGNYFFGYYDKSPLNINNSKLLACKSEFMNRIVEKDDILDIGYFDYKDSNEFIKLTETKSWNWQQGCMLQWFGNDYDTKIIYNDRIDDKFVTIIFDTQTKEKEILPMAYYTASSAGDFILCIDNERHCFYRGGYSYKGIENLVKKVALLENDGIWHINTKTKETKQIITLKQMVAIKPLSNMKEAVHYVEHLMISPNNKRFAFMHRWQTSDSGIYARLYTVNIDGSDLFLLNDSGRMSHYSWRNDSEIVGWGGLSNPINSLRKYKNIVKFFIKPLMPLYKKLSGGNSVDGNTKISAMISGDSYIVFTDKTNKKVRLATDTLTKDGHPSFSKIDDNLMITDTYPNPNDDFKEELILFDMDKKEIVSKLKLKHLEEFASSAVRCDLHPKWSHDGKYICVDTLDKGYRSIYVYEV